MHFLFLNWESFTFHSNSVIVLTNISFCLRAFGFIKSPLKIVSCALMFKISSEYLHKISKLLLDSLNSQVCPLLVVLLGSIILVVTVILLSSEHWWFKKSINNIIKKNIILRWHSPSLLVGEQHVFKKESLNCHQERFRNSLLQAEAVCCRFLRFIEFQPSQPTFGQQDVWGAPADWLQVLLSRWFKT